MFLILRTGTGILSCLKITMLPWKCSKTGHELTGLSLVAYGPASYVRVVSNHRLAVLCCLLSVWCGVHMFTKPFLEYAVHVNHYNLVKVSYIE